jgi:hypothetical protein
MVTSGVLATMSIVLVRGGSVDGSRWVRPPPVAGLLRRATEE